MHNGPHELLILPLLEGFGSMRTYKLRLFKKMSDTGSKHQARYPLKELNSFRVRSLFGKERKQSVFNVTR